MSKQITADVVIDTTYNLVTLTLDPDTLFIQGQTSTYSSPHDLLLFPCSYGNSWSSSWFSDLNFELTLTMFSYTHVPCVKRTYTLDDRSVTGWGKMRVNDAVGNPSDYFDVLQVQSRQITTDSFFISGTPFPGILLTVFLLQQGKKDTTYTQYYYRSGEITPLAKVEFRDAAFTQPYRVTTHVQRLYKLATPAVSTPVVLTYPNPAKGELHIQATSCRNCRYTISDISGRTIQSGPIMTGDITIPADVANGLYRLRVDDDARPVYTNTLQISR